MAFRSRVQWTAFISLLVMAGALGSPVFVPFGVNFSPYENRQDPSAGTLVIDPSQVLARLKGVRGYSQWVHNYSVTHGLETTGALAHQAGFKVALGAWLGPETDSAGTGLASNQQEIANLIAAANRGEPDMLVVGSEVLQRGDLPAARLLSYMQQVRSSVPAHVPVTTDDTYDALLANGEVIAGSDIVMANFYPYWERTRIDGAIASMNSEYRALALAAGSKEVWVGEAGWPSGGAAVNLAVPNPQNAAYYFLAFNSWAQANQVNAFYFEAYDEEWKAASEAAQGAHWGIRTSAGVLKEGMGLVYEGHTLPSAIFMRPVPASTLPGPPSVQVTTVPAYGSAHGIAGVVSGVQTADYVVATYINVSGGWWTKPTFANPTVPINPDGSFSCDTVTGGDDQDATEYEVFVVPSDYAPPPAAGGPSVPADIFSKAVASTDVLRPVGYPGSTTNLPVATIGSLSIGRSFGTKASATDIVMVTGTVPIAGVKASGANVTINIGSDSWQFAPVARSGVVGVTGGTWGQPSGRVAITAGKSKWAFSAKMACAPGNTNWDEVGLLNTTIMAPGIPVFVPVTIIVNGQNYARTASGYYTAQEGEAGAFEGSSIGLGAGL